MTPAHSWRAFFVFGCLVAAAAAPAATRPGALPELAQVGVPNAEEGARLIEQFRQAGIAGEYFLEFELRSLPRRGDGRTFKGRWWGGRNDQGAITRIEVTDAAGGLHRLLLQNGDNPKVWRLKNGLPVEVGVAELMAPLIPGVEVSAFDLQMPYLYWPGGSVEKITRVLGRPTNAFLFPAPASFKAQYAEIAAARAYFDTQFNVPTQTEVIGRNGKITKTLSLLSLQTVNKTQVLPKAFDYRNELTRDKTRLQIVGAALNQTFPAAVFQPAALSQAVPPPPAGAMVPFTP
uniref:hypothetical protein n=1 Tax=Horticoccus sp. 23ND18S-11 TaxID=3391832 RepID=UPI0039C9BD60